MLGSADAETIAFLVGLEDSASSDPLNDDLVKLAGYPGIQKQDDRWLLDPEAAETILAALERDNPSQYRICHERALNYLQNQLQAGMSGLEPVFMANFERLANRLLVDDEDQLALLVDSVRDLPLQQAAHQQLRRYFEGLVLGLNDRYGEALALFDALLAEATLDEHVYGRTLNSRAFFCITLGRLEEALAGHQASLALWRRLGNRFREGLTLLNLGILAYDLRQYDDSKKYLAGAAGCFEAVESPEWLAAVHNQEGLICRDQGDWEEALTHFNAAAIQWRDNPADLGRVQGNIGEVLLLQGRLDEAASAFQQALAGLRTDTDAIDAYLDLGLVYQAAGDLARGQAAFQHALDLALAIDRRDILAEIHYRLGEVLRRLGDDHAALLHFEAGVAIIEANREPLRDEGLKVGLLGRWQQLYEALVLHYLTLDRPAAAFEWAERVRARAFAEAIALSANHNLASDTGDNNDAEPQNGASVSTLAEIYARLPAGATLLCYFTTGVLDQDLPLLRRLTPDNPVREHLLVPARTLLFVATRDDLAVYDCAIDPNVFISASPRQDNYRRFLTGKTLQQLYRVLIEPVSPALRTTTQLYLIPHGPLHQVPFGALLDQKGRPLIQKRGPHLAYAPSITVLLQPDLSPEVTFEQNDACLAVGYDGGQDDRGLRHTEAEASYVAHLTGGEVWVGPVLKKDDLRRAAGRRRWLHFACHAQFIPETPLESYLDLGAGERLTALDVLQNWQLRAELVVLSACQTGVSRILRGDEPMGLIRAFLVAGAKAVLVSRWPIEDLPTFLLMRRFYQALQQNPQTNPTVALQAAQVWLRTLTLAQLQQIVAENSGELSAVSEGLPRTAAYPFAAPRHWAAFMLVGKV